jgi:hypothetical protein
MKSQKGEILEKKDENFSGKSPKLSCRGVFSLNELF